ARRLIKLGYAHIRRGQTLREMLEHLNRVIARINCGGERPPSGGGHLDELAPRRVLLNPATKPRDLEPQDEQVSKEEEQQGGVGAARPEEPLSPFSPPNELSSALPPAFRQEVQLGVCRRHLHGDELRGAGKDSLHRIAQAI